jgi:hypothetical protein
MQTDEKEDGFLHASCISPAAVIAYMKRKRSPNSHQQSPLTHSLTHGTREISPNHASRFMIKTWIHGQLLMSLLYSRNTHEKEKKTQHRSNQLPASQHLTKQASRAQ